jgi:predicted AlkP superfamily pyrophosphatase or phosphodiesterase
MPQRAVIPFIAVFLAIGGLFTVGAQTSAASTGSRVIVVGIDGLSVDGVRTAATPRLHQLMARAAWTLEARAVMPTLSSPNWESVITGSAPEQHGITSNGYFRKMIEFAPVCRDSAGKFPTIFELLRVAHPTSRIAVFHDWRGFADLLEKDVPDVLKHENGAAKTTEAAIAYWKRNHPDLMFVHLDNVDHAGHSNGWSSRQYYQAVEDADAHLGAIMDMLAEQRALDSTYILVTSDHGGKGHGHGKNSLAELLIPWILSGPGVVTGELDTPVNTFDSAATLAWIYRLNTPPCWIGRPVLPAFRSDVLIARANAAGANCSPKPAGVLTTAGWATGKPETEKGGN